MQPRKRPDRDLTKGHTETPSEETQHQRLAEDEGHDEAAAEAEGLEDGDLLAALAHSHAHRVGGHDEDREDDRDPDHLEDARQVAGHRHHAGAEGGLGRGVGLPLTVLEHLVDRRGDRRLPVWIFDLDHQETRTHAVLGDLLEVLVVEEQDPSIGPWTADVVDLVDPADDEVERREIRGAIFEADGVADLPPELPRSVGADDAAPAVPEECALLLGGQDVLRVHREVLLGVDRIGGVLEEVRRIAEREQPEAGRRDVLDTGDRPYPVLVGEGQGVEEADRVANDEARGVGTAQLPADRHDDRLQRAEEEDADDHREHGAGRADPVLAQVFQDEREEPHEHALSTGARSSSTPFSR